jgi:hypothetical protein
VLIKESDFPTWISHIGFPKIDFKEEKVGSAAIRMLGRKNVVGNHSTAEPQACNLGDWIDEFLPKR